MMILPINAQCTTSAFFGLGVDFCENEYRPTVMFGYATNMKKMQVNKRYPGICPGQLKAPVLGLGRGCVQLYNIKHF